VRKRFFDRDHFYGMSGHFVWLVPLVNVLIFLMVGLVLCVAVHFSDRGQKLATRLLATLAFVPPVWAAFPRIYGVAGLLLAMGGAVLLLPAIERHIGRFNEIVRTSFPLALCLLLGVAASSWADHKRKETREASRPVPPPDSPNVLLIVLDTVAASHLSLFGYDRRTSTSIDELASRGFNYRQARTTCSWTLPSHASMFTGRWPHELSTGWLTPLDGSFPTIAEYLGARGYATAGFAANLSYCAADSGLARGFTSYRDFSFPALTVLRLAVVVARLVDGLQKLEAFCSDVLELDVLRIPAETTWRLLGQERKTAGVINREFLDWLSTRRGASRPFFAFLNFYDAHHPYQLPPPGIHRFGAEPGTDQELAVIRNWPEIVKLGPTDQQRIFALNSYDDCVAGLDEQLGQLIDELERRAVLDNTWVIITADHGESFGEHPGEFMHGVTLYQTETHVPLVIVPPGGARAPQVVAVPVSLRDLAATIAEMSGFGVGAPFPGTSLVQRPYATSTAAPTDTPTSPALAELAHEIPPYSSSVEYDRLRWPLASLVEGNWSYFRRDGELREVLFNRHDDPGEQHNLANDPRALSTLEQVRSAIDQLTDGPLTPNRFRP
jgi:arylsulfatase A-like enzyme